MQPLQVKFIILGLESTKLLPPSELNPMFSLAVNGEKRTLLAQSLYDCKEGGNSIVKTQMFNTVLGVLPSLQLSLQSNASPW